MAAFVGLKEHFELSFAVLAKLLPRWYDDALGVPAGAPYAPLPFARMNAQPRAAAEGAVGGLTQDVPWRAAQALLAAPCNRFELALYDEAARLFWRRAEEVGVA